MLETLRSGVRQAERDCSMRNGQTIEEREHIKALERENRGLKRSGPISIAQGFGVFCPGGSRPPIQVMVTFIDDYRAVYGVGPICKVLPIASSTYYTIKAQRADLNQRSARAQRDTALCQVIQRVWEDNYRVYGARKVWL